MVNCIAWRVSWWPCCAFLMSSVGADIFHGSCQFCSQTCFSLWLTSLIILVRNPSPLPSTQPHCSYPSIWLTIWKFGAIAFNRNLLPLSGFGFKGYATPLVLFSPYSICFDEDSLASQHCMPLCCWLSSFPWFFLSCPSGYKYRMRFNKCRVLSPPVGRFSV